MSQPKEPVKVAIVTASTDGIGLAIARRLARDGVRVMVSSRREKNVRRAVEALRAEGLDVFGVPCDVSHADQRRNLIETTFARWGRIDILVSNAAVVPRNMEPLTQCTEAEWEKIFATNVKAAFMLVKGVYPHMIQQASGRIVLVGSQTAYTPMKGIGAYCISKTALLGMTKVLATELGRDNITVNCLAPGWIETKMSAPMSSNKKVAEELLSRIPLGRPGQPDDMAGTVSFLCSDDARYITGETIVSSGGMMAHL